MSENQRKQEFGKAQSELRQRFDEREEMQSLRQKIDEDWKDSLEAQKQRGEQAGYFEDFKIWQHHRIELKNDEIEDQAHQAMEAFQRWKESHKQLQILKRLEDKKRLQFKKEANKKAQKTLDDLVVMNYPSSKK
jgi:flagellar export protein FliJ